MPGVDLWHILGYSTPGAFRQAVYRGVVPIPLIDLPKRRGKFALRRDVAHWLSSLSERTPTDPQRKRRPSAGDAVPPPSTHGDVELTSLGLGAFGSAIRTLRKLRGRSQKEVALTAGFDPSVLAGIERGRRPPPRMRQVARLLLALNANPDQRRQLRLAWELSRLARALGDRDPIFRDTIVQLACWVASMPSASRAMLHEIVEGLSASPSEGVDQ